MMVDNHIINSQNAINTSPTLSPLASLSPTRSTSQDQDQDQHFIERERESLNDIEKNLEIEAAINAFYEDNRTNSNDCKLFFFAVLLFAGGLTMFIIGMITYAGNTHYKGLDLAIMGVVLLLPGAYGMTIPCTRGEEGLFQAYVG